MPETFHDRITYDLIDGVARIQLDHAHANNSLDRYMGQALHAAADRAADDVARGAARVVVVGALGKIFSVGGDLAAFSASGDRSAEVGATADGLHAGLVALQALEVPVVSVISGTAAGGGLGIALSGDIVIAASEAKLVLAYTASGLTPDCGLTWVLPRRISWVRTMDLVLTNRVLTGAEAADWGIVSRAVPMDELATTVETVVTSLRNGASLALSNAKRLMRESATRTFAAQVDQEASTISRLIAEPEGIEGVDAFLAKRTPAYR
jgi:2-(1,2-epoxy-1,2-dihydrophenyl)acetyl-CoA isomerase